MTDPDAFPALWTDLVSLVDAWRDRGVSMQAGWSVFAAVACGFARQAGNTKEQTLEIVSLAWDFANRRGEGSA